MGRAGWWELTETKLGRKLGDLWEKYAYTVKSQLWSLAHFVLGPHFSQEKLKTINENDQLV